MTYSNVNPFYASSVWVAALFSFFIASIPATQAEEWDSAGHVKYFFFQTHFDADNSFSQAGTASPLDQSLNLRLTAEKKWDSKWDTVIHYEAVAHHSDSLEVVRNLDLPLSLSLYSPPSDDARLFDLTSTIRDQGKEVVFHRLDRASIGYTDTNTVFRFGRQAVSWGNGMVFQPMDVFNPFSPTAIDKEYKTGDDMVYVQNLLDSGDDIQTVLIPRRDVDTDDIEADESSLAVKYHTILGATDLDILVSRHFADNLVGIGFATDWRGTVLRGDLVNGWYSSGSALSAVTSINYSWVWGGHNVSGFLEYYRNGNGISDEDYSATALAQNPTLVSRILRGEIFTLGKDYLTGGLTVELTPRWLLNPLLINNMNDGSWLTQIVANFDWKQDLTLLLGANIPFGGKGTEYRGISSSTPDTYSGGGRSAFLQLAYYF